MIHTPHRRFWLALVALLLAVGGVSWWSSAIRLQIDGTERVFHSHPKNVADLLQSAQVILGLNDYVAPPIDAPLHLGQTVRVIRVLYRDKRAVTSEKVTVTQRVPLKGNLRPILIESGSKIQEISYLRETFHDGRSIGVRALARHWRKSPALTLTLFDRITGRPEKVYDLSKSKKIDMIATGYYVGDPYVPSDETFLGYKLRRGLVAVDPKVIPLRSRLYVKGYGYAYASDTGSAIKGRRIDLAVKDRKEERKFMHRPMTVYVLEKKSKW